MARSFFLTRQELRQVVRIEAGEAHTAVVQPDELVGLRVQHSGLFQPLKFVVLDGMVLHAILGGVIALGVVDRMSVDGKLLDERGHPQLGDLIVEYSWLEVAESPFELFAEFGVFLWCACVPCYWHIGRHYADFGSS